MNTYRTNLLGGFELLDATGAPVAVTARKVRALLAFLALAQGRPQPRDKLAALLWADSGEAEARASLRQALAALRKTFGDAGHLIADALSVALAPGAFACDVAEFDSLARGDDAAALEAAASLYRGELLEGSQTGEPAFDDWLALERERLRTLALDVLARLVVRQEAAGAREAAVRAALRLASLDPLREDAHRALMRLYNRQGRQAAALRQYRLCREALQRELGVAPEPATHALYRAILEARRAPAPIAEEAPPAPAESRAAAAADPIEVLTREPELRYAVVLFADLVGFTGFAGAADAERVHAFLCRYRAMFDAQVAGAGGLVLTHIGSRTMAVFGVPTARGNDCERAVGAALAMRDMFPGLAAGEAAELRVHLGVASGELVVEREGGQWSVTGEPVSIACRIMETADPGELWLSHRVRETLAYGLAAEPVTHATIGAIARPVKLWRAQRFAAREAIQPNPVFVGREAELAQLDGIAAAAMSAGTGRVLVIRGEAGIGKSRLADAFALRARERGFACVKALTLDFGPGAGPVPALARGLLGVPGAADGEACGAALARAPSLAGDDARRASGLYDLLGLPQPAAMSERYAAMDAGARARGVRDALAALLALACTRGPLLMVVEDVHWLDPPSLDLLAHLAAHCRCLPALLVLTTRPDNARLGPGWRAASQGCPLTTIDLGPLSAAEAHAMARHYGAADEAFVAGCVARADGNPLFLDQLLRAGEARHGVPGSVQSLVLARLDRLPAGDRQVLQAASVLGQRFSAAALAPLAGASDEALERLVCEALIRPEDGEYLFVHALIREAVYASLLRSRRHHLHQRAAEWFAAGDLAARAGHLEAAGDGTAGAAWLAAAREEASRFHYERALRHAERGIALAAGDRVTRYALRCLRAESLRELGLTEDSVFAYHEALHDADAVGERARAWLGVAAGLRILDRAREALSALDEAERAAAQAGDDLALAEACWLRGNVVFPLGDMAGCLLAHGKARELARAAGSPVLEARALSGLGDAHYSSGRYLSAHELFAACIALARTHRLARVEAANLPMLAVTHWFRLEFAPAWECARTALRLTQATGDMRGEIITRISLAAFHQFDAHFEQAASEAEAGLRISRQLGARRFELESAGRLASALGGMGETARAEALLTEVIAQSRERDARYIGPSLLGWFVAVTCDADKRDAALAEGEALLAQGCVSHCYLDFLSGAADAMLAAGEWTRATRYLDMLADYSAPEPLPWNDWFIRRSRALVALGLAPADRSAREAAVALLDQGCRLGLAPLLAPLEAACAPASGTASINPGVNAP